MEYNNVFFATWPIYWNTINFNLLGTIDGTTPL